MSGTVHAPPAATGDSYTTAEDTPLNVAATGVLANDSDADSIVLTAILVAGPSHGSLTLNANGSFQYSPDVDYFGADSFRYIARDDQGQASNEATATLNITPVNDAPTAVNDAYSTAEDTLLAAGTLGVLINDADIDNVVLTALLVSGPAHGQLTLNPDGSFSYLPASNFNGTDAFAYKANDDTVDSNVATVTVTVTPVNDVPVAVGDTYTIDEDTSLSVDGPGVLGNDTDVEHEPLTAVLFTNVAHGLLALNANGGECRQ